MAESSPVFDQVNVISANLERSLAFYRLLGLDVPEGWRGHHASANVGEDLDLDFDSTEFAQAWNEGWKGRTDLAGRVVIGFRVVSRDEVDARFAALAAAGYRGLQQPYDAFWGARYAIVEDPDGLAVGLMSPVDPARRSAPPALRA
jgi:catechol 2,3-dioxygenase-like lactoylglutathione lyase family enzyme